MKLQKPKYSPLPSCHDLDCELLRKYDCPLPYQASIRPPTRYYKPSRLQILLFALLLSLSKHLSSFK